MPNASIKVKEVFKAAQCALTLKDIKTALPELKASEISMALCYFRKGRYLSREPIDNENKLGRKKVWLYHFHTTRLENPNGTNI
jgi:hypothetical protein